MVRPSSIQAVTSAAISSSESGVSTTNGYSTRQSVASVTCETRDRPSNLMLSRAVMRPSVFCACLRSMAVWSNSPSKAAMAERARASRLTTFVALRIMAGLGRRARLAAAVDLAHAVVERVDQLLAALGIVQQVVLR